MCTFFFTLVDKYANLTEALMEFAMCSESVFLQLILILEAKILALQEYIWLT